MSAATLHATVSPSASMDEAEILALGGALHKAHLERNPEGIAAPYAPHAVIYDLEPPLSHDGISIQRKRNWLASWDSPIGLEPRNFELTIDGDHAYGRGYLRLSGQKKGVDLPVSFWMRETLCFERARGAWRVVHEHTSVPFYMDASLRPAFDLEP